jgi:nitrile hydratase accessory protein
VTDGVRGTISEIRAATDAPGDEEFEFDAPWQARAFAITVALRQREAFPWAEFQQRLIDELDDGNEATTAKEAIETGYYEAWLSAIERLLLEENLLDEGGLADRIAEFADGERDASEFVVGVDGHDHDHDHVEGDDHP